MWDLDTIVKINEEVKPQYFGSGDLSVYLNEDVENEIGLMERQSVLDTVEYITSINPDTPTSLEEILGSFKNECFVEPDKWVVRKDVRDTTNGPISHGVVITAQDDFCSSGYGGIDTSEIFNAEEDEYFLTYKYTLVIVSADPKGNECIKDVQRIVDTFKKASGELSEELSEGYDEN